LPALEDAGLGNVEAVDKPVTPPFNALESIHLVSHAQGLDLDDALIRKWPFRQSQYHRMLVDTIADEKHTQQSQYMESREPPSDTGYDGEKGLFYAYLLYRTDYYPFAERQIERLADNGDDEIVGTLAYNLLRGAIKWERTRYREAWEAYREAGISLL